MRNGLRILALGVTTGLAATAAFAHHGFGTFVMDEDVELCDGVQEGLEALTYRRGVLNANEAAVAGFHDGLREAVPGIDDE